MLSSYDQTVIERVVRQLAGRDEEGSETIQRLLAEHDRLELETGSRPMDPGPTLPGFKKTAGADVSKGFLPRSSTISPRWPRDEPKGDTPLRLTFADDDPDCPSD